MRRRILRFSLVSLSLGSVAVPLPGLPPFLPPGPARPAAAAPPPSPAPSPADPSRAARQHVLRELRVRLGCCDEALAAAGLDAAGLERVFSALLAGYKADQTRLDGLVQAVAEKQAALTAARQPTSSSSPQPLTLRRTELAAAEAALADGLSSLKAAVRAQLSESQRQLIANGLSNAGVEGAARWLELAASVRDALTEAGRTRDAALHEARAAGDRQTIRRLWTDYRALEARLLTSVQKERAAQLAAAVSAGLPAITAAERRALSGE